MQRWAIVYALAATCLAASAAGQQRRPGEGGTPQFPPPTIQQYHPRSPLVVPIHRVPRAKYPVIDPQLGVGPLRVEYLANPLGIDATRPRLSWEITSTRRNTMQAAYQVQVARTEADLARGANLLWDSRRVSSDASVFVPYGALAPVVWWLNCRMSPPATARSAFSAVWT